MAYPHKLLPVPTRTSYKGSYLTPKKLTKMDDGSTRERRKGLSNPKAITLTWVLTWDQRPIFEGWLRFENVFGQNWVTMPVVAAEADVEVKFVGGSYGMQPREGGGWIATLSFIQRMPRFQQFHLTSLPLWPAELGETELDDFKFQLVEAAIESNISPYSLPQTRRRFRTTNVEFDVGFICTATQRDVLHNFYYNTLIGGTGFFRIKYVDGLNNGLIRAKCISHPEETEQGALYRIKLTLTSDEVKHLSQSAYYDRVGPDPGDDNDYSPGYFAENYVE